MNIFLLVQYKLETLGKQLLFFKTRVLRTLKIYHCKIDSIENFLSPIAATRRPFFVKKHDTKIVGNSQKYVDTDLCDFSLHFNT